MLVRAAEAADLPALLRICKESPLAPQWESSFFASLLEPADPVPAQPLRRLCSVALLEDAAVGFSVASAVLSVYPATSELESLAVLPAFRRRGVARALVRHAAEWARSQAAETMLLEVRESNAAARALYRELGFRQAGTRRLYYSHPAEDAIVLELDLRGTACGTAT